MHITYADEPAEPMGTIFNIQYFSIHDGPGIRTTLFLKGCPLHCIWCSNPESISCSVQIKIAPENCRSCGRCIEICTTGALSLVEGSIRLDSSRCTRCMECVNACKYGGISTIGSSISTQDAVSSLIKDRDFYNHTGGGVTVSGGEPLLQGDFLTDLLRRLHAEGIHTAIDTTGFASWKVIERVLPFTDLMLWDVKHLDAVKHRRFTGVDNSLILENLFRCSGNTEIWIRTPLIPGFNDDFSFTDAVVETARTAKASRCCFLPFHRWGEHKYKRLGLLDSYNGLREFEPDEIDQFRKRYRFCRDYVFI